MLDYCAPVQLIALVVIWGLLLALGTALVIHPGLGTGVQSSSGKTETDFITALLAGGSSMSAELERVSALLLQRRGSGLGGLRRAPTRRAALKLRARRKSATFVGASATTASFALRGLLSNATGLPVKVEACPVAKIDASKSVCSGKDVP